MEKWIWLSLALKAGTQKAKRLLEYFGTIEKAFAADEAEYKKVSLGLRPLDIERLCNKDLKKAQEIALKCGKKGIRIIPPTSREYPERLWQIANPPAVLYAKGKPLDLGEKAAIAVVGTRRASRQGLLASEKFGREIAECGGVVVTGLAKGADARAAYGALRIGGATIAVLGCGVDICYPRENRALFGAVEARGTIISEYPPETAPTRESFPLRNRIMSGISLGAVIIEAPKKSGALITAAHALEQNRDVFAVPSGIFESAGVGSNELIRDGAVPVISGYEVMREYEGRFGVTICEHPTEQSSDKNEDVFSATEEKPRKFKFPEGFLEKFSGDDRAIVEAIGGGERRADELAAVSGMKIQKILACLTLLEIRGIVVQLPGARFKLKDI